MRLRASFFLFLLLASISLPCVALEPIVTAQRGARASHVVTGFVISNRGRLEHFDWGQYRLTDTIYTTQIIVMSIEKGSGIVGGNTLQIKYRKALNYPFTFTGSRGQLRTMKHYSVVRTYLSVDETTGEYWLLEPNGFDLIHL